MSWNTGEDDIYLDDNKLLKKDRTVVTLQVDASVRKNCFLTSNRTAE